MSSKHYGKRAAAFAMAMVVVTASVSGCGKKSGSGSVDAEGKYNLKAMAYDHFGNPMKGENGEKIVKMVEDYTNVNLDVMWTPKDGYEDKLNLVLAGGGDDMPQIIATPQTIDHVYQMLRAFTYDDPDGNGQNDTYGLVLTKATAPLDIMQTWFGAPNGWGEQEGKLVPAHQTEEYLEALKWFRKLCEEGIIKKNFPTRDVATKADDLKTQKAGMMVDALDDGRRVMDYFQNQNIAGPEMDFVGAIKKDGQSDAKTMATLGCQGFFVITKAAKTEEDVRKCLDFLDKMNDEDMMTLANYGLKDAHYTVESDGRVTRSHDATLNQEYQAMNQLVSYTEYAPNTDPYVTLNETPFYEKQQEVIADNEPYAVSNPAAGILGDSEEYIKNGVALDKIIEDARIQYIVGQIDEAQLKSQWELWSKSGGDKVIEEVNASYEALKK